MTMIARGVRIPRHAILRLALSVARKGMGGRDGATIIAIAGFIQGRAGKGATPTRAMTDAMAPESSKTIAAPCAGTAD